MSSVRDTPADHPFRILLAEPQRSRLAAMRHSVRSVALAYGCSNFESAERRLRAVAPNLLVTNLRLGAGPDLQLVQLTVPPTRCVVYMVPPDLGVLREAQDMGAFVETWPRVPAALPAYVGAQLPPRDRRDLLRVDRRTLPRGGRRAADGNALATVI